jgi:hypothetical protein
MIGAGSRGETVMSRPLARVALGVLIGAAGVALLGPHIARRARPAAKAALKAALAAIREARIRGGEIAEAAEDLYAEAKAEAETEAAGGAAPVAEPTAAAVLEKINSPISHRPEVTVMTKQQGLDGRHRDKNGRISKKHGNTLISTLRQTYGAGFAPGRSDDERLADVLHDLDEPSLSHLIHDLQSNRLDS